MAYAKIEFTNPENGRNYTAPVGFSWTTLFFGFFPAIIRGHVVGALAQFGACLVTLGLSSLVFPFFYNKWYLKSLLKKGFEAKSSTIPLDEIETRTRMDMPELATA